MNKGKVPIEELKPTKELDVPFDVSKIPHPDSKLAAAPMSDELKAKLRYAFFIALACVIGIGIIAVSEIILSVTNRTMDGNMPITTVLVELLRTIALLAVGFIFGNHVKN